MHTWRGAAREPSWEEGLAALTVYVCARGTADVPSRGMAGGVLLGRWVAARREEFWSGTLAAARAATLQGLPGGVWGSDPHGESEGRTGWARGWGALRRYVEVHGAAARPSAATSRGIRVGLWVDQQRAQYWAGSLSPARIALLQNLTGWTWTPPSTAVGTGTTRRPGLHRRERHHQHPENRHSQRFSARAMDCSHPRGLPRREPHPHTDRGVASAARLGVEPARTQLATRACRAERLCRHPRQRQPPTGHGQRGFPPRPLDRRPPHRLPQRHPHPSTDHRLGNPPRLGMEPARTLLGYRLRRAGRLHRHARNRCGGLPHPG